MSSQADYLARSNTEAPGTRIYFIAHRSGAFPVPRVRTVVRGERALPAGRVRGISFETTYGSSLTPSTRRRPCDCDCSMASRVTRLKNSYAFVRSTAASFISTYPQRASTPRSHADESRQRFETRATAWIVLWTGTPRSSSLR